jgi:hypothetical protein
MPIATQALPVPSHTTMFQFALSTCGVVLRHLFSAWTTTTLSIQNLLVHWAQVPLCLSRVLPVQPSREEEEEAATGSQDSGTFAPFAGVAAPEGTAAHIKHLPGVSAARARLTGSLLSVASVFSDADL